MKSVVVEASTVAKAIEIAWTKAEKPEEFFVRILQEHQSGFLGFGALKAKIVLFFKNTNKSDSLFPVVLKQKEYISFFGNQNLKVPTELNVVDAELNKNVSLGGGNQKKKPHHNQQQKNKQPQPESRPRVADGKPQLNKTVQQQKPAEGKDKAVENKQPVHAKQNNHVHANKAVVEKQSHGVKQVQIQQNSPKIQQPKHKNQPSLVKNVVDTTVDKTNQQEKSTMQVTLQAPESKQKPVANSITKDTVERKVLVQDIDKKDDVINNITKVLKKVQSQKIVANVSKPTTPKFGSYEEYVNATGNKVAEHKEELPVEVVVQEAPAAPVVAAPRVAIKMKRRPLTTENPGVSGITKSTKTSEVETEKKSESENVMLQDSKNEKE